MFAAFKRSFSLIKESYHVLRKDPELILLALFSFGGLVFLALLVGIAGLSTGAFDLDDQAVGAGGYVLIGLTYFVGYFIVIYFEVALVASIQYRMAGGDPNVRYGLSQANKHLGAIVSWALIAATVGLLLRALESAARGQNGIGRIIGVIIIGILGFAWALMVFFVIPVIAAEGVGGIEAIKRSSRIVKQRWGEAIIGTQGIGLIMMIATVVVAAIPFMIGMAAIESSPVIGGLFFGIAGAVAVFMWAAGGALDSTYRAVLFAYASTGDTGGFSRESLEGAFRPKDDIRSAGF